ncbi:MAG: hypothetical protein C4527_12300 [Candidatus Omnitrophota bacterium]|jgi:hypothetical protein|nr:MAG: hypothetical protein C4527_12300 [Candidatus Omnitrophota bacterium]
MQAGKVSMAALTREQLIQYVRKLEQKVRQFQQVLKERDQEILTLKRKVTSLIQGKPDAAVSTPPAQKVEIQAPKKVQPLEEKPKTFVKKPAVGATERAKEAYEESHTVKETDSREEEAALIDEMLAYADKPEVEETAQEIPDDDSPYPTPPQEKIVFKPSINFQAGEFLSAVLDGEEEADEVKALLESLKTCEQDQKRNIMLSLTSVHWRMIKKMALRLAVENLSWEKRLFMRYGMLDEKLMSDRMDIWEQLYLDKSRPENTGIYFIDEWFDEIARGNLKYSTIDEMALDGRKPDPHATGETALGYEVLSVPQMQRMCVGARANLVSIMVQEYCAPARDNPIINRKWLMASLHDVLKCDYLMFHRKYKGEEFDVQPLFIISPGYGQRAGCWEPWSPGKKGSSGPRICLCAFPPRSSMRALLMGLADYRWEYAKADAMHYWISEGLTGKWLALFNKKEQRKDMKQVFIDCYFHWVQNEARRIPKLEKRFREFFWRNTPFGDEIKQNLKGGGMFARMIEMEDAKKKRDEEEQIEIDRIKAEREARKTARRAKMESG